jgi:hypothetical protein
MRSLDEKNGISPLGKMGRNRMISRRRDREISPYPSPLASPPISTSQPIKPPAITYFPQAAIIKNIFNEQAIWRTRAVSSAISMSYVPEFLAVVSKRGLLYRTTVSVYRLLFVPWAWGRKGMPGKGFVFRFRKSSFLVMIFFYLRIPSYITVKIS